MGSSGAFVLRMRMLLMVVVMSAVSGCIPRRIAVANTPEGNECRRQCMQISTTCLGGRGGGKYVCRKQENECLATCPGSVSSD